MKKLVFSAVSLDVGGIETALVTLLNYLAKQKENEEYKYEITLFLEKKEGIFLNEIDNLSVWPSVGNKRAVEYMKKVIREKYELFGCINKNR